MSRRGVILFLSLGLIWGLPYLLIKVSVEYLSPEVIIFLRVFLAAIIMMPVVIKRGYLRQLKGYWKWVFVFAIVEIAFPFGALTFAEIKLSSSMTGLLIAAVPIVSAVFAWRLGIDDRITGNRVLGLAIGVLGVGALVGFDVSGSELFSAALLIITVIGYALGPIIVSQKLSAAPALAAIAMAMVINSVIYAPLAFISRPRIRPANVWLSVAVLGAVCTALASSCSSHWLPKSDLREQR